MAIKIKRLRVPRLCLIRRITVALLSCKVLLRRPLVWEGLV